MVTQNLLHYEDAGCIVDAKIVFRNSVLCLDIITRLIKSGKESEQFIPVEFLSNFDSYMFGATFKTNS